MFIISSWCDPTILAIIQYLHSYWTLYPFVSAFRIQNALYEGKNESQAFGNVSKHVFSKKSPARPYAPALTCLELQDRSCILTHIWKKGHLSRVVTVDEHQWDGLNWPSVETKIAIDRDSLSDPPVYSSFL